jgi:hypothetical protein
VGFTDTTFDDISDFRLTASSPYKNAATDGKDIGANIERETARLNPALAK